MNTKLTYIEARDKIWNAYFRDEVKPYERRFCFCGTLCDNRTNWASDSFEGKHNDYGSYLGVEYVRMERALFNWVFRNGAYLSRLSKNYEDAIFAGMLAALEVLKQIHRDRGDYIPEDETPLTKRRDPRTLAVYDGGAGILS